MHQLRPYWDEWSRGKYYQTGLSVCLSLSICPCRVLTNSTWVKHLYVQNAIYEARIQMYSKGGVGGSEPNKNSDTFFLQKQRKLTKVWGGAFPVKTLYHL